MADNNIWNQSINICAVQTLILDSKLIYRTDIAFSICLHNSKEWQNTNRSICNSKELLCLSTNSSPQFSRCNILNREVKGVGLFRVRATTVVRYYSNHPPSWGLRIICIVTSWSCMVTPHGWPQQSSTLLLTAPGGPRGYDSLNLFWTYICLTNKRWNHDIIYWIISVLGDHCHIPGLLFTIICVPVDVLHRLHDEPGRGKGDMSIGTAPDRGQPWNSLITKIILVVGDHRHLLGLVRTWVGGGGLS